MDQPIHAEIEFPLAEVAAAFEMSEEEVEGALQTGMIKVEQENAALSGKEGLEGNFQWRLTLGEKVVVMPIILRNQ